MSISMEVNRNVLDLEYAVRGPIPQRAAQLRREGRKIIPCNIGNPQALGQKPLTFYRQVLSLMEEPTRIERERAISLALKGGQLDGVEAGAYSEYVLDYSERLLAGMETGMGAYTDSPGPPFIREAIARFIDARDGVDAGTGVRSDPAHIFLTNGASEGVRSVLELLIAGPNDGIMIPIPQYPLYSATIRRCGGVQVNYYPDEDAGWNMTTAMLEESISRARADGVNVKAVVVINPANPTGAILDESSVRDLVRFAGDNSLVIIADEVYQENVYGAEFVSFARALGDADVPLFSLNSASKGFYGECGHRGGYLEVRSAPKVKGSDLGFTDLMFKQASVNLCSNTAGQVLAYLTVSPPEKGSEPHAQFVAEKETILSDLHEKATRMREAFKEMEGVRSFGRIGAMYLFPRLEKLPQGTGDFEYCMSLLEETGLCTVNGSGFGQREGTHHLRIAFLPPRSLLDDVLPRWVDFHNRYVSN